MKQVMHQEKIVKELEEIFPESRIKASLIDLVAYASDAGFYYLRPLAVVLPVSEDEIINLFEFARKRHVPLVFRAAGTSLSGQSITDGILVDLSQHWDRIKVEEEGSLVRVQPGAIGAMVNTHLKKNARKIGPDPASINSAMMGGIISNNASGMCCGVSHNSYHTIKYIRFILPDGKVYSTECQFDYIRFKQEYEALYLHLAAIRTEILNQPEVFERIRKKYQTKNTVGYGVNAFIDYEEPLDILAHLLVGAEGTLAFIAEAVMETIPDHPEKSTTMLYFPDIYAACKAIIPLKESGAAAVELMDRASLRSVEHIKGMPEIIKTLPETAAALLVEYQGKDQRELKLQIDAFLATADELMLLNVPEFTTVVAEQALLWKVRKGMFPAVGAVRASGTSVILEDVAFPIVHLADAIADLQGLFKKHGYKHAIIFGHAKDGNIHFVITQAFDTETEITRYNLFLNEVVNLVVDKYDGALKAEHGTGRNMAPFVEKEWGAEIYHIMKSIKEMVDPYNLLNPGVIINADQNAHISYLKELPTVEEEVDRCMECGFCEHMCPSRNITLTPRKRIVVRRELLNLSKNGNKKEYQTLLAQYQYQGLDTCAVDGLCATACPVDINTGDLVKRLRKENHSVGANKLAMLVAKNFKLVSKIVKLALISGGLLNKVFGPHTMSKLTKTIKKLFPSFPLWSAQLAAGKPLILSDENFKHEQEAIVYFPACISRVIGDPQKNDKGVMQTLIDVSAKANIQVILPSEIERHCCGQIFSSKGFTAAFGHTANETISKLWESTKRGRFPIVLDISSCTQTLLNCRNSLTAENKIRFDALKIIDSIEYIADYVIPKVKISKKKENIVLHPVCSIQKMDGVQQKFNSIANHFAEQVTQPLFAGCCGMAGDRGFLYPELTAAATKKEVEEVKEIKYDGYYSSSKTCEIALSDAVGQNYYSILRLVDECSNSIFEKSIN
ncbi:FAD-binding and (Fe-S)-binding domain-containing protein [Pedobacter sp. B4-66]|uniref:FAD-binding and (Fe-S)-binding domain-containing protein n=1 Tax=Pedobacter sp. B4-66 TaxID=2817280 RepID=UPI0020256EA7|nr:FAD-binding and (Fe-S)-binding domain-containing protein [Pedobacter sp. B4-66]